MLERLLTSTAKKSYVALFDQGIVSGTNFLTGVLLARLCSKEQYGLYILALSLLFFVDGLRHSFVGVPFVISLPQKPREEQPAYIGATTLLHALLLLGGALIFGAAAGIVRATGSAPLAAVILAGIVTLLGYSSREQVRRFFYAQLRVRRTVLVDGVYCVLQLGALAALWQMELLTAVNALLALGAVQIAAALFGFMLLWGTVSFRNLKLRSVVSSHWKLGKWLVLTSLAYFIATQIYPWFLKYTSSLEAAAILGACLVPLSAINPIVIGFNNVLVPRASHVFAQEGIPGLKRVVWKWQVVMGSLLGISSFLIAVFSRPILDMMYAGKYSDYSIILSLIAIRLVLVGIAAPISMAILILKKPEFYFYATVVSSAFTLTIGLPLVYFFGVMGAALGLALASIVSFTALSIFYRRCV